MSLKIHQYKTTLNWTGNTGAGTRSYQSYERSYSVSVNGKPELEGSSDPSFRGDASKYNPEELFLASISSCHMLWYLHLCSANNIVVLEYSDNAEASMEEQKDGSGRFTSATLHPVVKIENPNQKDLAMELHHQANKKCFIANSCNFPIHHQPEIR